MVKQDPAKNHYTTLEVNPAASLTEIKQAYRRLAKQFHPDRNREADSHDRITQINAAYEVLSDPYQRQSYDRQLNGRSAVLHPNAGYAKRQERANAAQKRHRQQAGRDSDEQFERWINQVYQPVTRLLNQILKPLKQQLNDLAADPFDDQLLAEFQNYLEDCRADLQKAQRAFRSMPNPSNVASVAAHLYYCLNQVSDGIDELERFTTCYDEHYLHRGQELFRIAGGLRREAQAAMREIK
ncbi:MAG: J domain-containing protein [Elainella sp.]